MKFILRMQINTEVFYNLILSFWVWVVRHAQSTQNKKFTYLCNSLKNVGNEVNFLATNKHQNFLQIHSITLDVWSRPFPNNKFAIYLQYLNENAKDDIDFLPVDKH